MSGRDQPEIPQAFKKSSYFHDLPWSALADLANARHQRSFSAGETLFLQGDPAVAFHLVDSGQVKVVQTSAAGQEILLHVFEPGGLIGALPTLGEGSYPATAIALDDVVTYRIEREIFESMMTDHPQVMMRLLRFATQMLQSAHARLRQMATDRVERRIAQSLARLARQVGRKHDSGIVIDAPISRQDIADMCGTTVYTVSRTLKEWQRAGLIEADRKSINLLKPHALIEIAEDIPHKHS